MSKFIWKIGKKEDEHFGTNIIGFFNCPNNIYALLDILIDSNSTEESTFGRIVLDYLVNMPSPQKEGFNRMNYSHACACSSVNQLLKWFNFKGSAEIFDLMEKHDLKLYKFKAETVFNGNHQVIYEKESVSEIKEFPLTYLKRKIAA